MKVLNLKAISIGQALHTHYAHIPLSISAAYTK